MTIDAKHLLNLPVETTTGRQIGRVRGFRLDTHTHTILQYEVRRSGILKELLSADLLIHQQQVISITNEKMVVDDLAVPEVEQKRGMSRATLPSSPS
ncbi:MAG: PRC-barrel domain-containing protein [bacterium]